MSFYFSNITLVANEEKSKVSPVGKYSVFCDVIILLFFGLCALLNVHLPTHEGSPIIDEPSNLQKLHIKSQLKKRYSNRKQSG